VIARRGTVTAIVSKDLRLFARDRFYAFVSVLGLVAYALLFWLLPATVDETIPIGVHLPAGGELISEALAAQAEEGLDVTVYDTAGSLTDAVAEGELQAGLDLPAGFVEDVVGGEATTVRVIMAGDAPEQVRAVLTGGVREIAFALAGEQPPVVFPDVDEMVIGGDGVDGPVPLREQFRPLLVFLMLMTEMLALASLVAAELVQGTVSAVLVTPTRVADLLAAKTLLGTTLASGQALVLAAVTGTLAHAPGVVVVALLLGGLLVTGFGLIAGAVGRDFMTIVFWSMLFLIPLAIPAFSVLFPGTPAGWVQAIPTYGLVEALLAVTVRGQGWSEAWQHLATLAAWCVVAFGAGALVLGRRVTRP